MSFTEDSRVKIPTILHLMRLGYEYLSLKGTHWDKDTNIFPELFSSAVSSINPDMTSDDVARLLEEVKLSLDNEDLGRAFFNKLKARSGTKLIDFENFSNNSFHVVTELTYKNGDDEFRPDIILLINGMPLVFIEVKKPNNRDGIIAERERINKRFQNPKFKRFANITQFMIFSNNMDYVDGDPEPVQGAFYASSSYDKPVFNYFREEEVLDLTALLKPLTDDQELAVLKDNNLEVIRSNPEFLSNKEPSRPTNRICTSLLSKERLSFVLRYALVYVSESDGLQKHIMRYPQMFATKAIERKLNDGVRKGIIWHTQGSGKTALTYYNVGFLTDYFQKREIIPKFYFIVDRLDLLQQAQREFTARGLIVHTINSREAFTRDIKATQVIHNHSGKAEITVVNIQKFKDDPDVISTQDYNVTIQRVYFLDEVHRSYNPKGSFLANLTQSDSNAIKIGLTGTPLLGEDYNSRVLFGDYIHKYYYNASIADGYTLRLIREEIATNYKMTLQQALEEAEVKMGDVDRKEIYAHQSFVEPMLDYIISDFEKSRGTLNDATIGGMIICDSSDQAKKMFELFNAVYASKPIFSSDSAEPQQATSVAEPIPTYVQTASMEPAKQAHKVSNAALILHDVGTKQERKDWVEDFKAGKIDLLFVYNMLLTGFDAKRLKKLYLGRVIRKHNLLQALTRVNRTYKDFRYGYVVDFADIRKEFDATNKAYFDELQSELGDEIESYSKLFKSQEEIKQEIEHIKDVLFRFDIDNMETFCDQISQIQDRETVLALKNALADARSLYNLIRLQGEYDFLDELDFTKLNVLFRVASDRLDMLNLAISIQDGVDIGNLLNRALEDVIFTFTKIGEEELVLADKLKNTLRQTREALASNFDQQDPKFINLKDELERLFKKKNLSEVTQDEMVANIDALNKIHQRVKELNRQNNQLRQKYLGDTKYARLHKRLYERQQERRDITDSERKIFEALLGVKEDADSQVLDNTSVLDNESYFERHLLPKVHNRFIKQQSIPLNAEAVRYVNHLVVAEYLKEFNTGSQSW
ncbi:type I restriction endonuclease subunit R [Vibrio parahaemolyticus]|uniref:type I restriction endonuclease subunit R n=1 Tax=Vibrio parahaemolyticus TaxID=670 RepID=UPI0004A26B13|nr:type I restriction endonuclease [Vibrio parahaemolyticus]EGQ8306240.1 type I restriction endonuclease subunit R [Vibrio parahaemolyticus]EGR2938183.1 type I restriction endonuclease subunit R [Vibrio parahaemolyticus]EGR3270915.1 type I restriction endonuclease subunit R [Vibrio parahaemolyticus]EGR3307866.1 type I restriction endonuclease subunit R [Vibrio parahaemolyticus]EJG0165535.1 type I restriction endonuclease subunit R [Vibrio parahaemolyticus]